MILRSGTMMGSDEKRRRISAATIPAELLISEVIARLPAKSIARFRCVCRSWYAGTTTATFVRRHRELSCARPPSSVLAIPCEIEAAEISLFRLPLPPPGRTAAEVELMFEKAWPEGIASIVYPAHCDGLVAFTTTTDRVFVCNPGTGELVPLPPGTHNAEMDHHYARRGLELLPVASIGFDQWRNSYVVARYFYRTYGEIAFDEATGEWSQDYNIGHEVFTLGGGGSWEVTEDPPHAIGDQSPVCTRRGFYWHSDVPKPRLMRFGLQDRAFEVVPRPPTAWNALDDMVALDGKLCYVHVAGEASFQVWLADDEGPGDLRWSLLCRVDIPDPAPGLNYSFTPVIADGDTLVAAVNGMLYRYNLHDGTMEQVVDMQQQPLQYRRPDGSKYKFRPCHSEVADALVPYFETLVSPTTCNY